MPQKRVQLRALSTSEHQAPSWRQRIDQALYKPVDAAGLVYFRVAFGTIMLWQTGQLLAGDWAGRHFSEKNLYFTYWPFDFVHPWPGIGMHLHLFGMAIAAVCIIFALCYRVSATVFFCLLSYVFLLEKALYLNHFYLSCLTAGLLIFVPAHRYFSLDGLRHPTLRALDVPAWSLGILRFQIGVVYFYGGIAKIKLDWLSGEPLRHWLPQHADFPWLEPWFTNEALVLGMTYGALVLDLFVVFFLLSRRTRVFGYIFTLLFHLMNSRLFNIAVFPWMMIAMTAVFFAPDWPRQTLRALQQGRPRRRLALIGAGGLGFLIGAWLPADFSWMHALIGALGAVIAAQHLDEPFRRPELEGLQTAPRPARAQRWEPRECRSGPPWLLAFLGVWVVAQVLIPLRHVVIPGNVDWTDEGRRFAWHMLTRQKDAGGFFVITDPETGQTWYVNPQDHLSPKQYRTMIPRPDMIVQFARYLEARMQRQGYEDVEVRADILASLNGRKAQPLIDPDVDLTTVPYPWWGHAAWIRPLVIPLRERSS